MEGISSLTKTGLLGDSSSSVNNKEVRNPKLAAIASLSYTTECSPYNIILPGAEIV